MPFTLLLSLILILFTWAGFRFIEKRSVLSLWFSPVKQRGQEFFKGFLLMALLSGVSKLVLGYLNDTSWSISADFSSVTFLKSIYLDISSVLLEELMFRGFLLYLLIKLTTSTKGALISAVAFGIYHWFTFGVLGNPLGMILVLITTGLMGYVFARAYTRTNSIVLPFGLHLGWNLVNNTLFSNGPNGIVVLSPDKPLEPEGFFAIISFGWYLLIPVLVLLFVRSKLFDGKISNE